jgi:long-subunit fatty acid transport protein
VRRQQAQQQPADQRDGHHRGRPFDDRLGLLAAGALQAAAQPESAAEHGHEPEQAPQGDHAVHDDRGHRHRAPALLARQRRRLDDVAAHRARQKRAQSKTNQTEPERID